MTLDAIAAPGSELTTWSGDAECSSGTRCEVTMDTDRTVTVAFGLMSFPVTVTLSGDGTGTVSSADGMIDCSAGNMAGCTATYEAGTEVTLSATPEGVSAFAGWSGDCSGTDDCVLMVERDHQVGAAFDRDQRSLSVTLGGNGSGSVSALTPAGTIDCGIVCSASYEVGTMVTLTADADTGSTFTGWEGACTGTGDCMVTMDMAQEVTATFTLQRFTLMVTRTGGGTIVSEPTGITCGGDCNEMFDYGTMVTLTAVVTDGVEFTGWSGAGCSGLGPCRVTITANTSVSAAFEPCGAFGDNCCPSGATCLQGACLQDTCVTFGGVWGGQRPVSPFNSVSNRLFSDMSACPPGFQDLAIDSDQRIDEGTGESARMHLCQAAGNGAGDLRGAYIRGQVQSGTAEACMSRNDNNNETNTASCPSGATQTLYGIRRDPGDAAICVANLQVCTDDAPRTFGGMFYQNADLNSNCDSLMTPALDCIRGNPPAGDSCFCPSGFSAEAFDSMRAGVSSWGCEGILTVCVRQP